MRTIVRYKNRKYYDKQTNRYVSLSNLTELVNQNEKFQVLDYNTKKDLTNSVLASILKYHVTNNAISNDAIITLINGNYSINL